MIRLTSFLLRSLMRMLSLMLAIPAIAAAQTPAPPARQPGPAIDFAIGGLLVGPTSFGSRTASFTRPDGSPMPIFETSSRLAPGYGLEAHLSFGVTRRLVAEASGAWQQADFETKITGDIEGAADVTATTPMSRFTVEGAAVWQLTRRGKMELFARGGVGWMRELTGNGALLEDGLVGSAGVGLKYWWRERVTGPKRRRLGLRVDGRANVRSAGLTLGERKIRFSPVVFGGVVFGF